MFVKAGPNVHNISVWEKLSIMATEKLVKTLQGLSDIKSRLDDDFADRLSRQYTTAILLAFAFVVSTKQFVGQPISCWCPAHFTESHRAYTDTICWISNTFYHPIDERVPDEKEKEWNTRQMVSQSLLVVCYNLVERIKFICLLSVAW